MNWNIKGYQTNKWEQLDLFQQIKLRRKKILYIYYCYFHEGLHIFPSLVFHKAHSVYKWGPWSGAADVLQQCRRGQSASDCCDVLQQPGAESCNSLFEGMKGSLATLVALQARRALCREDVCRRAHNNVQRFQMRSYKHLININLF